jgi:hypothetical protein
LNEVPKFSELVAGAITDHGKATADILRRLDQDEEVDLTAETIQCLGQLAQTGARFFLFWDNIATLLAQDGNGPIPFGQPKVCAPGEKQDFELTIPGIRSAEVQSGLRRRGDDAVTIPIGAITLSIANDQLAIKVDCSGARRGLYEGMLAVVGADGAGTIRAYNVYIDPAT